MNDPYRVLGVSSAADDATIQAAYLTAVKDCPPERDVQRFESVRTAYEAIRTRKDRIAYELFDTSPPTVNEVLERIAPVQQSGNRPGQDVFSALLRGET